MAVLSVVYPNMNMYLIDEPAEALDEGNKLVMAQLFSRMAQLLPTMDGMMLIVTRDQQIMESCSNVIRVGE